MQDDGKGEGEVDMIRRSQIRYKKRVRKVSWRSGTVREDAAGMARLRSAAFRRSGGRCECYRVESEFPDGSKPCGGLCVTWVDGHMHHSKPRSDVLERVSFIRRRCHEIITGELQWSFKKVKVGE